MPSPFPGMDPYLEDPAFWQDFHWTFINYWREALADQLPDHYEARIGERVFLEEETRVLEPDVSIHRGRARAPRREEGGVVTLEPRSLPLAVTKPYRARRPYIEILRRPDRVLVTALELLSPSNKSGKDRRAYIKKRDELIRQDVHIVELDLLLGGLRIELGKPLPPGDYYYFVARADRRPTCEVYVWGVRDPLPRLPVPLRAPTPTS